MVIFTLVTSAFNIYKCKFPSLFNVFTYVVVNILSLQGIFSQVFDLQASDFDNDDTYNREGYVYEKLQGGRWLKVPLHFHDWYLKQSRCACLLWSC